MASEMVKVKKARFREKGTWMRNVILISNCETFAFGLWKNIALRYTCDIIDNADGLEDWGLIVFIWSLPSPKTRRKGPG